MSGCKEKCFIAHADTLQWVHFRDIRELFRPDCLQLLTKIFRKTTTNNLAQQVTWLTGSIK